MRDLDDLANDMNNKLQVMVGSCELGMYDCALTASVLMGETLALMIVEIHALVNQRALEDLAVAEKLFKDLNKTNKWAS